ncbi:hypothetical protein H4R23_003028, partial [Coemansia sp. Cherry 401B]
MYTHTRPISSSTTAHMSEFNSPSASSGNNNSQASVDFVRHVRKTFEAAYGAPTFIAAAARRSADQPSVVSIAHTTSQRDFASDRKRKVAGHMALAFSDNSATVLAKSPPADASSVVMSQPSPVDPSLVAVLHSASKLERTVEIWHDGALVKSVDVSKAHGDFYGDSTFGSLAWSADGSSIVYAAEKPEYDKAHPETDTMAVQDSGTDGDITDDIVGGVAGIADPRRYEFDGDWGETFNGKRPPALAVFNVSSGAVQILPPPDGVSPGQAQCLADRIVFTGYKHAVRKHGIVYCQNRPTGIYTCYFDGKGVRCLFSGSVRSPRITPSGKGMVFLSTTLGGPHASTSELLYYDIAAESVTTLVPIIDQPLSELQTIGGTQLPAGFVGIYADQLPTEPWVHIADDSAREVLVFSSIWRSTVAVLTLDLEARTLSLQTPVNNTCDNVVLGAAGDIVVGKRSTPAQPEVLMVGEAAWHDGGIAVQWYGIGASGSNSTKWQVIRGSCGDTSRLESIFIYPPVAGQETRYFWSGSAATRPLAVVPHGGPHSTYTLAYNALAAGLARLGFGVLLVNFTGSLGFGQDAVLAQIGQMDTLSIDEIQAAAADIHARGHGDAQRTVYVGGSYSGYTGAL